MSSIYIHVPFCKTRCHYCDFYSTLSLRLRKQFTDNLINEIHHSRNFLTNKRIKTLYIGGGTPSVLSGKHLEQIIHQLHLTYTFDDDAEKTMEVNPDDLSREYLQMLLDAGFNRLSIGVQSFNNHLLKLMGRRHNAQKAHAMVKLAYSMGFENISIDLIYGLPDQTIASWMKDLKITAELPVKHLSAYHLTYEKGTLFHKWKEKGTITPVPEDSSVNYYEKLIKWGNDEGFNHYEISSFTRPGYYSRHNNNYWMLKEYLGLGPAAHSFQEPYRYWNKVSLNAYLNADFNGRFPSAYEKLSRKDLFNDYIITALRTKHGISFGFTQEKFGQVYLKHLQRYLQHFPMQPGLIQLTIDGFHLTEQGFLFSDKIFQDLLLVDDYE